jgi:galactokinase
MQAVQTRAPGRVNIIGEHTDYNDGFVLPCAIAYDTRVFATARPDNVVTVRARFDQPASFELERMPLQRRGDWSDYVRGILIELQKARVPLRGADLRIEGTVPVGAGLSSSASLEVAVALAMLALADASMDRVELARLAQRAETEHAGARVGIMDQFTVLFAREGDALLLDTRTLEFDMIPIPRKAAIVICNSMVKHDLAASAYNERRTQCEQSVRILRERYPEIRALRDVTEEQLGEARHMLPPPLFARARHVVTENARVVRAVEELEEGNLSAVGALMYASHESLRDDYEVSSPELDVLVHLAREFDGTIGARLTGAGFGGCTVNLIHRNRAADFRRYIASAYARETGIAAEVYDGTPSAGASTVRE